MKPGGIGMSAAKRDMRISCCGDRSRACEEKEDENVTELLGAAGESHQEANEGHRESRKGHKPDGMRRLCRRVAHMPLSYRIRAYDRNEE